MEQTPATRLDTHEGILTARRDAIGVALYFDLKPVWGTDLESRLEQWLLDVGSVLLCDGANVLGVVLGILEGAKARGECVALDDTAARAASDFLSIDRDRQAFLGPAVYAMTTVIDEVYAQDDPAADPMWGWSDRHAARKAEKDASLGRTPEP